MAMIIFQNSKYLFIVMKFNDQIKLNPVKPGIIPSIIKLVIVASLIMPMSCISSGDQEDITSYIDPTIGNVSRFLVPTYTGDEEWFASDAFQQMLPKDWPLEHRRLDEIMKT